MTYGFSRDDVGRILETYFDKKILESIRSLAWTRTA